METTETQAPKYGNVFEATMAQVGYEPKTTFWDDFTIAERYGDEAIRDTYRRAFDAWRGSITYLTELVMVLNHKIWYFYDRGDMKRSRTYDALWRRADAWCMKNLKGDDKAYYLRTTD